VKLKPGKLYFRVTYKERERIVKEKIGDVPEIQEVVAKRRC